jgi:predicted Zn finger-like uncharacterized protein
MKFLCPQCKAKYRIADEKLAERASSRMKCRKCGHVIDIHGATVPDDSIPPPGVAASELEPSPKKTAPAVGRTTAAQPAVPAPRRGAAAPLGAAGARRPLTGTAGGSATAAAVKRPVAPPRRGGAAVAQAVAEKAVPEKAPPVAEKPPVVEEQPLPTAPAATRPAITRPFAEPPPKAEFEDEPTRIHDGSSLAAAFSSTAGQAVAEAAIAPAAGDEWYIGIDGSPLGPVGLAALREKAAERKATFESLVWREGFEEWKPLKEFPELVALVEEARRDLPADQNELRTIPAPSPLEAQKARAAAASDVPSELLDQIGARPKGVSHPAAWTAVIVAIAFGVTIGSVLLSKTEKQEVVKYVEVPASAQAAPAPTNDTTTIEESTVSGGNTKKVAGSAQKVEPAAPTPSGKTGMTGLNGLNGLSGLGPATQGPDVTQGTNLPGGQLDGTAIQRVVANFTSSVRRGCWDSALASRTPDAPSSARVMVTITIASSGSVDNVTTSGDPKGYPNLAHCIESKVRAWRFPRSSGTTTAQVPFVFAAQ